MDAMTAAKDGRTSDSEATSGTYMPTAPAQVLDITVLMGGPSSEREVSLVSGGAIADALERIGHKITRADITPEDTVALDRDGIDVVFIALHGNFGEDGKVQQLCEKRGLRYIGSPPRASQLAMDKAASKEIFRDKGLATAPWVVIQKSHSPAQVRSLLAISQLPVVVKPVDGGSSVDVTIARTAAHRDQAVADCVTKYGRVMVEKFIHGRECTVGILGSQTLPVIEIKPAHEFYDYTAKYTDAGTQYVFNHGLSAATVKKMQSAALAAANALGCRDMCRVDFIVDDQGTAYILEINTIPGFTSHSLLPMAAGKAGIGFDELVDRLVGMAMKR